MALSTVDSRGFEQGEAQRVRGSRTRTTQSYGSFTPSHGAPAYGRIIIHKSLQMEKQNVCSNILFIYYSPQNEAFEF